MKTYTNYVNVETGELYSIGEWEEELYLGKVWEVRNNPEWKECTESEYSLYLKIGKSYAEYLRLQEIQDE